MKIAFLLPVNEVGGGIFVVYEHARRLSEKLHDITILFPRDDASLSITSYDGLGPVRVTHFSEVVHEEFDFVFATYWTTAYEVAQLNSQVYGYIVQGDEENFLPLWRVDERLFVKMALRDNFLYVATTPWLVNMLKSRHRRQATLIPIAISKERFENQKPLFPKGVPLRVLIEGSSSQSFKRIELAFSVLKDIDGLEVFFVAGDGVLNDNWRVNRFFPKVPYREMPAIYASCDVLLKLSSKETFALPVLEMFATGGTAVVSAFEGHDQYIFNEKNALVVPIDDKNAAIQAIMRLRDDRELLNRLKTEATRACDVFSWERSSKQFERLLIEKLKSQRKDALPVPLMRRMLWLYERRGVIGSLRTWIRNLMLSHSSDVS